MRNVELCNDGKCKRVRMGEERHSKHNFSNNFTKKSDTVKNAISVMLLILAGLVIFFQFAPIDLEITDRWIISIASMAVIMSMVIAMMNWHLKNKQLQTQSLFKVFELLSSPDIRKSRKSVHDKYCEMKEQKKKIFRGTEVEDDADKVLSAFDQISATVLNGLLDKDLVFDTYGEMMVRDWKTLEDEIDVRQKDNAKTVRHFTFLKDNFEEILKKDPNYRDSDTDPYCHTENSS